MIGLTHASHRLILQIIKMQYCCLNFQSLDSVPNLIEQSMESNQNHHSIMVCSRSKQKTIPNLLKTKLPLPPLPSLLAHPSLQHNLHITVPNPQYKCCDTSSKDLFRFLPLIGISSKNTLPISAFKCMLSQFSFLSVQFTSKISVQRTFRKFLVGTDHHPLQNSCRRPLVNT